MTLALRLVRQYDLTGDLASIFRTVGLLVCRLGREKFGLAPSQALTSAIGEGGEPGPEPSQLPVAMPLAIEYASFT